MKRSLIPPAVVLAVLLGAPALGGPIYMKIEGVDGSYSDASVQGAIEVESMQMAQVERTAAQAAPRGGKNVKVALSSMNFTHHYDKASPVLLQAAAKGKHFSQVALYCRKSGQSNDYLVVKLEDCVVTSYQAAPGAAGGARPMESLSINFAKIAVDYKPLAATLGPGAAAPGALQKKAN